MKKKKDYSKLIDDKTTSVVNVIAVIVVFVIVIVVVAFVYSTNRLIVYNIRYGHIPII